MFEWIVQRKLERIGRRADPSRAFVVRLEKQLRHGRQTHTAFWKVAMTSMTSATVLFLGTGTYAYASDNVLPDHPLYPVRQTIEDAESALAVTPAMKAKVGVRLLGRRLHEEKILAQRKKIITAGHVQRFIAQTEKAIEANRQTSQPFGVALDAAISSMEEEHAALLEQLREQDDDQAERMNLEKLLNDQTSELQERVKTLTASRQEQYRALLERRTQEIPVDEVINALEAAYAEVGTQLDAERDVLMLVDELVDAGISIPDLIERSIVVDSQD